MLIRHLILVAHFHMKSVIVFGLLHIWGDEAGCANSDFRQLGGTCVLPHRLLVLQVIKLR